MRSERYQITLVVLGIIAAALFGVFFYRELFPEYRIYQDDYIALEKFRSTYSGEPAPAFRTGVKQIVFEREDKGPPLIDRCTSCHVALQLPHFSATKIAHDVNGNIVRDPDGTPTQVKNEDYIWAKLDQKIADLKDERVNQQLADEGESSKIAAHLKEAKELEALKTAHVGEHEYDVSKVLSMHPLIGKETRPFEFHAIDEYGCTSCHNGNGKGLTTDKAHGPVFDGDYETEFTGPEPEFLARDVQNDPQFARVFNHKPADALLFQTSPILVGSLMQAKCVQCHAQSHRALQSLADAASNMAEKKKKQADAIQKGFEQELAAMLSLYHLQSIIQQQGLSKAIEELRSQREDLAATPKEIEQIQAQLNFISKPTSKNPQQHILDSIHQRLMSMLGTAELVASMDKALSAAQGEKKTAALAFIEEHKQDPKATGTLFFKGEALNLQQSLLRHVQDTQMSFSQAANDEAVVSSMSADIDALTKNYQQGQQLYISQACYACHRIAGLSRGGVGPELTRASGLYPWYMKEKIIWPQGTLKTSTMPNMHLDHTEVEDLMTFLLGQNGPTKAVSQTDYKIAIQEWEAGRKQPWEKPIPPSQMHNLSYAMTIFATQGCAACHRLKGFESNVGYRLEKEAKGKPAFEALYKEHVWFQRLFPEDITGPEIVKTLDQHAAEIDQHIVDDVRSGSLLEELEEKHPESVKSLYADFRYADRAKNHLHSKDGQIDPQALSHSSKKQDQWKQRVHRVLMMYVQEYGLGRLIGPRPNWSGVYRSDEWLMEHFRNPAGHVPNSIMPILPFDDSKFYALTYMLDALGKRNRDEVRAIWENRGFDPSQAFNIHCAQCHGDYLQGNGPVATWIYPIPKNLRNAEFLRNLTKEKAIQSITHGVKGTPMPPWGETPADKYKYDGIPILNREQINMLVDWLYTSLPGGTVIKSSQDVPKWQYAPQDVIDELRREGHELKPDAQDEDHQPASRNFQPTLPKKALAKQVISSELLALPSGSGYFAALEPTVSVGSPKKENEAVQHIFDVAASPIADRDTKAYFIKNKFYTPHNLEQGKIFFENNCAACHGKDADGAGVRASIMINAKPRMLINLDWLKSRDDLRLLQSIKYGVPGTAMTPWGDATSSLQRLQLVMYIRSLSRENTLRDQLTEGLYSAYAKTLENIESARLKEYAHLEDTKLQLEKLKKDQALLVAKASTDDSAPAIENYKQQLEMLSALKMQEENDQQLLNLKKMVKREEDLYKEMGIDLLRAGIGPTDWALFIEMLTLNANRFVWLDGELKSNVDAAHDIKINELAQQILAGYDAEITKLQRDTKAIFGKIVSDQRTTTLKEIEEQIKTLLKAKRTLLKGLEEIALLHKNEESLVMQINHGSQPAEKGNDNK